MSLDRTPALLFRLRHPIFLCLLLSLLLAPALRAADLEDARQHFIRGHYQDCIKLCDTAINDDEWSEEWRLLLIQSMLTVGQYTNAQEVLVTNLSRYATSVRLRVLGYDVFVQNGDADRAQEQLLDINYLAGTRTWAYSDAASLVALGKTALLLGQEPKKVLDVILNRAKKSDPSNRDVYLVIGRLALDKGDFELAAKGFSDGLKRFPDDPEFHFGLAEAYAPSDRRRMLQEVNATLTENTNHTGAYLLMAEHLIDAEEYLASQKILERVFDVNPWHPSAWAYRSVIAHLEGKDAAKPREKGLRFWTNNPAVDHLIGKKLSQKYRFKEGSAFQRQALSFDEKYLPAKIQLAGDLLRLGQETEGWQLADEVHKTDGYDVTAFNLMNLHDKLEKFQTLTNEDFIVRMSRHEASIYGPRVMDLLKRAKTKLCEKYGMKLTQPITVEIFSEQKDFGVRTFGMPDNPGYLGVCFGSVITANSPAAQAKPANWEAVLWHEFCHVVTLNMTHNKMPRWVSEGISVYEEKQENPSWGQDMRPSYRDKIVEGELTPVGELSSAFLAPASDLDLQFAYYQSSLVIEFIVKRYGFNSLLAILKDLGDGVEINKAIVKHTIDLNTLEEDFATFAEARANELAPKIDWTKPKPEELANQKWAAAHTNNYYVIIRDVRKQVTEKSWKKAKPLLEQLVELYPNDTGPDSSYLLLAQAHRELGETNAERTVLNKLVVQDANSLEAYRRLMELDRASQNWSAVVKNGERFVAVNPLSATPYEFLGEASEAGGDARQAVQSYQTLLLLDPPDPARAHYRLARQLHQLGDATAKRHVLQALEEAPRFRDAQKLLLELSPAGVTPPEARNTPGDSGKP